MLLYQVNLPEYLFLRDNGVDNFVYEPVTQTYYLRYWDGSIYNQSCIGCASFTNKRADGLPVMFVIEYKYYLQIISISSDNNNEDTVIRAKMSISDMSPNENEYYQNSNMSPDEYEFYEHHRPVDGYFSLCYLYYIYSY